ncbi:hypothetical protein [Spirillospora sp. CA-294931]|uniref:hypothetical protein n=1 Tax=Spirillospora sp. CA-294931 TaxID=3240042 RepID=UPI003D8FE05D
MTGAMAMGVLCGVVAGLVVAELSVLTPWAAGKLARRAARACYARDPERAEERAEEWDALIAARPGNVLKLATALLFFGGAVRSVTGRRLRGAGRRAAARRPLSAAPLVLMGVVFAGALFVSENLAAMVLLTLMCEAALAVLAVRAVLVEVRPRERDDTVAEPSRE